MAIRPVCSLARWSPARKQGSSIQAMMSSTLSTWGNEDFVVPEKMRYNNCGRAGEKQAAGERVWLRDMWCGCGIHLTCMWYTCGVHVVQVWHGCGMVVVYMWCGCGVHAVHM